MKYAGLKLSDCLFFFDFDNTITPFDVLDDLIECFSVNKDWIKFEKSWKQGEIGSKECLEEQLRLVKITKKGLKRYLSGIEIDHYFKKLLGIFKGQGISPVILSDNFSFIIDYILHNNGIRGLTVYANELKFSKHGLLLSFPYADGSCFRCGHCKKSSLFKSNFRDKITVYIGDGLSDICPSQHADFVFAKGSLLKHFKKTRQECVGFKDLGGVYEIISEISGETSKVKI